MESTTELINVATAYPIHYGEFTSQNSGAVEIAKETSISRIAFTTL